MSPEAEAHLSLQLQGLVQGVGFRPHVVRLAAQHGLRGTVANSSSGVELELEGRRSALETFMSELLSQPPPRARIDHQRSAWSCARAHDSGATAMPQTPGVRIITAGSSANATALVSPDLALCSACLAELHTPSNRRFGYPFISCTNCGPRYSVVEQLPFEREHTSFSSFALCPLCNGEFNNPSDRRFHAQTISCPACGPQLHWNGRPLASAAAIQAAADALAAGAIVALQGIGGFQLLADPGNQAALQWLRQRKGRPDKPLALLAGDRWLEQHCHISADERVLWQGPAAPILLLRPKADRRGALAPAVAGSSPWLGVMRPCSGLQHLLLERWGGALVATSANRSGEPICSDAVADRAQLEALADEVLSHTLPIVNRIDDSVLRWTAGGPLVLRLGRGLAPIALMDPTGSAPGALALGAQVKGAFALQTASHRLLSPDLGDLGSLAGAEHHQSSFRQWLQRHGLSVSRIACDQHPGYSASQMAAAWASSMDCPLRPVQHHHAHLLAVMAEHNLPASGSTLGVAWDGSGQGDDGSLWGGEALAVNANGYQRIANLRPFPLPGGERAQREPRRAALGLLLAGFGSSWRERLGDLPAIPWRQAFTVDELLVLEQSVQRGINAPLCSSIGRLFDAVAALLNLEQRCSYEAQAAMALEGLAWQALEQPGLSPCVLALPLERSDPQAPWQWNWQPLLQHLLQALEQEQPAEAIALGFHRGLAEAIAALAAVETAPRLLLSGGCFQNALLLELTLQALNRQGCEAFWPQQLPCNDAALPIGQLLAEETMPINPIVPQAVRDVPGRCR